MQALPQAKRPLTNGDGATRQLASELAAVIEGEVRFDDGNRALYAYDASIYRQVPIGVVIPRHAEDVVAALEVCRAHDVPVFGRGGGTSLNGQCCNVAVVFDFSKYMHGVVELNPDERYARVLPGTVLDTLRDQAEEYTLTFGPDPATHTHCTLGGMIGNNSCGTHSVMAGKTSDNILELDVLTYDGLRMRVGPTGDDELQRIIDEGGRRGEIYAGLKDLRDRYGDMVREHFPDIPRRVSGYNLNELLPENGFNVARALVGTESTCVLVLEAKGKLVWSPPKRALVVLGYPTMPDAGDHVPELMEHELIGLEYFDGIVITNQKRKDLHFPGWDLLPEGDAWLLAEFGGETQDEADEKAQQLIEEVRGSSRGSAYLCKNADEQTQIWDIRRNSAGTSRMPLSLGGHGGWPNFEDAAVPPERLGDWLRDYLALLDEYGYTGVFYGHFGQGCVHSRLDFQLRDAEGVRKMRRFCEEATDLTVEYGGSLSGEHGDGQRAELLTRMYPPELIRAFEEFKGLWDPRNRMNPGKVVHPYPLDVHLREGPEYRTQEFDTHFAYHEDGGSFAEAAARCYGVGACRKLESGTMCPSYMVTREEKHSTRGRARLLLEMSRAAGPIADKAWRSEEVKEALDLCLSCKGCKGECPVKVDVAMYKAEFLSHYYSGRLRPMIAYAIGLMPLWARVASRMPGVVNRVMRSEVAGQALKSLAGVAQERELPEFAPVTFRDWFEAREPRVHDGSPVILWPDTFTNYFQPEVAIAAVEVLESAGFRVQLPERVLCCGRPLYDFGMLTTAKRFLRDILDTLRPHISAGVPVVGLEPSCVAVFRDELVNLFPRDEDARRLSGQTYFFAEFLEQKAPDFEPPQLERKALVQVHCHQGAVKGFDAEERMFQRLGLDVERPDSGCCGMAGSFGFEDGEHYDVSMACGERVILPKVREADEDTLILADGYSCREQIEQGTGRRPLHLAEVLQMALRGGRPPEIELASMVSANGRGNGNGRARTAMMAGAGLALTAGWIVARRRASQ